MKTKAKVTMNYGKCSPIERANLIYMNYSTFEVIIECFKEDLINDIQSEQRYIKRSGHGELGVRVQGSGMYSDPTESQASIINNKDIILRKELLTYCLLLSSILLSSVPSSFDTSGFSSFLK